MRKITLKEFRNELVEARQEQASRSYTTNVESLDKLNRLHIAVQAVDALIAELGEDHIPEDDGRPIAYVF